jgi:hypothetical protein
LGKIKPFVEAQKRKRRLVRSFDSAGRGGWSSPLGANSAAGTVKHTSFFPKKKTQAWLSLSLFFFMKAWLSLG